MKKLALSVPGYGSVVNNPPGFKFTDANSLVSGILQVGIYIAFVIAMSWMAWGVFQYIVSGGNKESLARARSRITWALIGLAIVLLVWSFTRFFGEIFSPQNVNITPVNAP